MSGEQHQEFSSRAYDFGPAARQIHTLARDRAKSRSSMYGFFAAHYLCPPDEDLVQHLRGEGFRHELASLFGPEEVAKLSGFPASVRPDEDMVALRQEYMDLFVVPSSRYVTELQRLLEPGSTRFTEYRTETGNIK